MTHPVGVDRADNLDERGGVPESPKQARDSKVLVLPVPRLQQRWHGFFEPRQVAVEGSCQQRLQSEIAAAAQNPNCMQAARGFNEAVL